MKPSIFFSMLLILTLSAGSAVAEEKGGFWDGLLKKINRIASHGVQGKAYTSVVGIRGAETDAGTDSLYWKGEAVPAEADAQAAAEAELAAFQQAVTHAVEGDYPQALKAFQSFVATYPESELTGDATDAIAKLEADIKTSAAPAQAPAVPEKTP